MYTLPLPKAAYFLFFGAMAFVVPFLSVFLRERCGLRPREIGLLMGGTRVVQSGKFAYSLTFVAGAGQRYGEQTNTQTNVRRAVRRVPLAQACTCRACM